jgi:hypothetical protein
MDGQNEHNNHHVTHGELHVDGLNEDCPGNIPLATSRAQSTYLQHAVIDFDGLSWPSKYHTSAWSVAWLTGTRQGHTQEERSNRTGEEGATDEVI